MPNSSDLTRAQREALQAYVDRTDMDLRDEVNLPSTVDDREILPANIPAKFWTSRPLFHAMRDYAHSRMFGADAFLHSFLAAYASQLNGTGHRWQIDTGLAMPVAFTYFVALAGRSGSGKTTAFRAACELAGNPRHFSPASGEGLVEHFMGRDSDGERVQTATTALCFVDEGSIITQLAARNGSTLSSKLIEAATGGTLSTVTASGDTTRYVEGGSYSMGFVVNLQNKTSADLLSQTDTGFKQRFVWVSSQDASVSRIQSLPDPLPIEPVRGLIPDPVHGPFTIGVESDIRNILFEEMRAGHSGDMGILLDSQRNVAVLKIAGLLTILDDRRKISIEDWQLAELLYCASEEHVGNLIEYQDTQRHLAAIERGAERAVERRGQDVMTDGTVLVNTMARVKDLTMFQPMKAAAIRSKLSHPQRVFLNQVLDELFDTGQLRNVPNLGYVHRDWEE